MIEISDHLSKVQIDKVKELLRFGYNHNNVAYLMGIPVEIVSTVAIGKDYINHTDPHYKTLVGGAMSKLTVEQKERLFKMKEEGCTKQQIAEELGVSLQAIGYHVAKRNKALGVVHPKSKFKNRKAPAVPGDARSASVKSQTDGEDALRDLDKVNAIKKSARTVGVQGQVAVSSMAELMMALTKDFDKAIIYRDELVITVEPVSKWRNS